VRINTKTSSNNKAVDVEAEGVKFDLEADIETVVASKIDVKDGLNEISINQEKSFFQLLSNRAFKIRDTTVSTLPILLAGLTLTATMLEFELTAGTA